MVTITREQLLAMSGEEVYEALTGRPVGTRIDMRWLDDTSVDQSADTVVGRRRAEETVVDRPSPVHTVIDSGRCRIAGHARDAVRYADGISMPPPGHSVRPAMRRGVVPRPK